MLNKYQVNFKEIQTISRRCWNIIMDKFHEANSMTTTGSHTNGLILNEGYTAYIPKHKVIQTGVIKDVLIGISEEELVTEINSQTNRKYSAISAFNLKRKDPKTKIWVASKSWSINFKVTKLPQSILVFSIRK